MARLKVKKELVGAEIYVNPMLTLVFSEYMSDADYQYALNMFPDYFDKPKKVKKNDKAE